MSRFTMTSPITTRNRTMSLAFFSWYLIGLSFFFKDTYAVDTGHSFTLESANGGCIGVEDGEIPQNGAQLMLVDCDSNRDDIIWNIDSMGKLHSFVDSNYCWTAYQGRRIGSGKRLRLYECDEVPDENSQMFNLFEVAVGEVSGQIRFDKDLCVVHQGQTANIGEDNIIIKDCESVAPGRSEWQLWSLKIADESAKEDMNATNSYSEGGEMLPTEFLNPFEVDLPYFSGDITQVYSDPDLKDVDKGLAGAAAMVLNRAIMNNLNIEKNAFHSHLPREEPMFNMADGGVATTATTAESVPTPVGDVTDYETNVQEKGVDEADFIKADANHIYASYGDYIIVWDKAGKKTAQIKMPPIAKPETAKASLWWNPKPHIKSLLLTAGHLVVFVSGNGRMLRENLARPAILYDYLDTQIRVYKTPDLEFVGMKNVNGRFMDARSVGSNVHAVTISGINTYSTLIEPLARRRYFPDLSDEEYYVAAQEQALQKNIPDFIKKMREELSAVGHFPKLLQINRWQQNAPDDEDVLDASFSEGVANNVAWVTSFDVLGKLLDDNEFDVSTSSFLTPDSWLHMYGTQDQIILATQGWNWNAAVLGQEQSTYLLGLELDGPSTDFISVGTIAGHLLNSFALDIHNGELRVATTIRRRWRWMPRPVPLIAEVEPAVAISVRNGDSGNDDGEDVDDRKNAEIELVVDEQIADESLPARPIMPPRPPPDEEFVAESSTENYVIVLKLQGDEKGEMTEMGRVQIGEPHESITAVRFFDDFAYVVTFERTDPFYVIDLIGGIPKSIGEFKLNGFSSYLHPMTPDNKFLIGIGQNATSDGRVTGLMITIFNATVPENPVAVVSYTVENEEGRYSSSNSEWEHKSFRYINGKVILPLHEHYQTFDEVTGRVTYGSFDGFAVFNITTEAIAEHFRVSHNSRECHYCGGYLPPRSFIYDGNLMTVKNSVITSTDLDSGEWLWTNEIVIDGEDNTCCPYYLN